MSPSFKDIGKRYLSATAQLIENEKVSQKSHLTRPRVNTSLEWSGNGLR